MKYILIPTFLLFTHNINAQCETWHHLENTEQLEEYYVLYRQYMKEKDFDTAFSFWEKIYETAPAADGKREKVYSDGRKLYFEKFKKSIDSKEKREYAEIIIRLYGEGVKCYPNMETEVVPDEVFDFLK